MLPPFSLTAGKYLNIKDVGGEIIAHKHQKWVVIKDS